MVQPQSDSWWFAKYEVLATLVDRGASADFKLSRVGLENIERVHPESDDNKYGMKDRFLRLKQKIKEALKPK